MRINVRFKVIYLLHFLNWILSKIKSSCYMNKILLIAVTTLSGLTFGLMFGLLRVDTPLTYILWLTTYIIHNKDMRILIKHVTCIIISHSWYDYEEMKYHHKGIHHYTKSQQPNILISDLCNSYMDKKSYDFSNFMCIDNK